MSNVVKHPVTGRTMSGHRVTGHYPTREELENAIAITLAETPEMPWQLLGERHGVSPSTARNITIDLIKAGRIQPANS